MKKLKCKRKDKQIKADAYNRNVIIEPVVDNDEKKLQLTSSARTLQSRLSPLGCINCKNDRLKGAATFSKIVHNIVK
jgi:hypothetical protein